MKYLLNDLTDTEWKASLEAYWENFKRIENRFSKAFCSEYRKTGFHDFLIYSVCWGKNIETKNYPCYVEIILSYDQNFYKLHYIGVTKFNFGFHCSNTINNQYIDGEFLEIDSSTLSHEIYFGEDKNICIEFKKLRFTHYSLGLL